MKYKGKSKSKNKNLDFRRYLYPAAVIVFYGVGVGVCSVCILPQTLSGNFFFGIDGNFSAFGFIGGWMYQFIPFLVIMLSGYDLLGAFYSGLALSIRSYIAGYAGRCFVSGKLSKMGMYGVVVFTLYTFLESLILIMLLSGAIEQGKFRKFYLSRQRTPFKMKENGIYIKHNLQRCGIMIILYVLLSIVCYLI